MWRIVLQKLVQSLLILPGVVTLLFLIFGLMGDPARMLAGQRSDQQTLAAIRAELGLDKPLWHQYLLYLHELSPIGVLDSAQQATGYYSYFTLLPVGSSALVAKLPYLRRSYVSGRSVGSLYAERLPATILLAVVALLVATSLGLVLGVVAARYARRWPDQLLSVLAMAGVSAPSFFVAVVLVWLFAITAYDWTGLNLSGYIRTDAVLGTGYHYHWRNLLLPALTLGIRPLSILFQLTRSGMLDALQADYVRTARAKGLPLSRILWRHALPNAITPVFTALSGWLAALLTGAFFVEYVFDWPGVGKLTIDALYTNDYPVVLGSCLITALVFIVVNMMADLLYPLLDPRIRLAAR